MDTHQDRSDKHPSPDLTYQSDERNLRLALLFPGQGSQQVGMGWELANRFPIAAATFEEADDLLGYSLSKLCFEGPEEELTDTRNAQPALLATSIATLRVLANEMKSLPLPVCFAGHSMGEYSALVAAGSLSFADGLHLVRRRGELMASAGDDTPGVMAALLGLDEGQVEAVCATAREESGGVAQIANDNCPGQIVISGDRETMELAMEGAREAGARRVVPLAVSIAAHSPLMQPAAAALAAAIEEIQVLDPAAPIIGNTSALPLISAPEIGLELVEQLTGPVRWTESMGRALEMGAENFVEIGPGEVLSGLVKRIHRKSKRYTVGDPDGVQKIGQLES